MEQKLILNHSDPTKLANLGKAILTRWPDKIDDNVNFDPGSPGDPENLLPPRTPSLQFICPNNLSGEIIMFCIQLPGVKIDLKSLDIL